MNLLAIDTAGKTAAVAVLRDEVLLYEAAANNGLTHSETLLPMVDTALKACGLRCADIDLYGVTAGPGSFTGLRIGLAAVKGMALPRQLWRMAISPAAILAIIIGIKREETRRGPLSSSLVCSLSKVSMPPMPVPKETASRSGSMLPSMPLSAAA